MSESAATATGISAKKPYYSAVEYTQIVDEVAPWLVEGLLPAGGSLLMHGQAKQGKSIAAMQLAYAVACGETEWLGFPVTGHGRVLYVQLDTGRQIWKERTASMNEYAATVLGKQAEDLFYVDKQSAPRPFDITKPDHFLWLRTIVEEVRPVLVFIDVLRNVSALPENDSDQMIIVLNALEAMVKPAALVIVTHTKKVGQGKFRVSAADMLLGAVRGSTALVGAVDAITMVYKKKLWFQSRTADASYVPMRFRKINGFVVWEINLDPFHQALAEVVKDRTLTTKLAKAEALQALVEERTKKKPELEKCRTAVRRALDLGGPVGAKPAVGDDDGDGGGDHDKL